MAPPADQGTYVNCQVHSIFHFLFSGQKKQKLCCHFQAKCWVFIRKINWQNRWFLILVILTKHKKWNELNNRKRFVLWTSNLIFFAVRMNKKGSKCLIFINKNNVDLFNTCSNLLIFYLTNVINYIAKFKFDEFFLVQADMKYVSFKYALTSRIQNDRSDSTSRILTLSLYKIRSKYCS